MGRKLFELERDLPNLDITDEQKETIKVLIDFYHKYKKPSLDRIIDEITELAGRTGMFVSAEKSAGHNDKLVQLASNEVDTFLRAKEMLETLRGN